MLGGDGERDICRRRSCSGRRPTARCMRRRGRPLPLDYRSIIWAFEHRLSEEAAPRVPRPALPSPRGRGARADARRARLAASEALLERERGVLADVLKIRFFPFAVASGAARPVRRRRQRLPRPHGLGRCRTDRLRTSEGARGHCRRARPAADGDALLLPHEAAVALAGRCASSFPATSPRRRGSGPRGRTRTTAAPVSPDGDRPAPSHLLHRWLPRHDDRLSHALRPPGAGVGDRRRPCHEGSLPGSVSLRLRALQQGRLLAALPRSPRALCARRDLAGRGHGGRPHRGDPVGRGGGRAAGQRTSRRCASSATATGSGSSSTR